MFLTFMKVHKKIGMTGICFLQELGKQSLHGISIVTIHLSCRESRVRPACTCISAVSHLQHDKSLNQRGFFFLHGLNDCCFDIESLELSGLFNHCYTSQTTIDQLQSDDVPCVHIDR